MKWLNKNWGISSPKEGDTRVVTKFLLWPRNYKNSRYWYWLEKIDIVEEFTKFDTIGDQKFYRQKGIWKEIAIHNIPKTQS